MLLPDNSTPTYWASHFFFAYYIGFNRCSMQLHMACCGAQRFWSPFFLSLSLYQYIYLSLTLKFSLFYTPSIFHTLFSCLTSCISSMERLIVYVRRKNLWDNIQRGGVAGCGLFFIEHGYGSSVR